MAEEKVLNEEVKDEETKENEESINPEGTESDVEQAEDTENKGPSKLAKYLLAFVFPGLVLIFYVLSGLLFVGAWRMNWLLFLAIPTYCSGLYAYQKKNFIYFLFPLIVIGVYLFIGLAFPNNKGWHPYWLILLEIPLYYVAVFLVKAIVEKKEELEEKIEEPKEEIEEPVVIPESLPQEKDEKVIPVIPVKEKKDISNRRLKKALHAKEKKVKVVTEMRNYNKEKRHFKIKADITHHHDEQSGVENSEEI